MTTVDLRKLADASQKGDKIDYPKLASVCFKRCEEAALAGKYSTSVHIWPDAPSNTRVDPESFDHEKFYLSFRQESDASWVLCHRFIEASNPVGPHTRSVWNLIFDWSEKPFPWFWDQ